MPGKGSPAPQSVPVTWPNCVTPCTVKQEGGRGGEREELFAAEHTPHITSNRAGAAEVEAMRAKRSIGEEVTSSRQAQSKMAQHVFPYANEIYFLLQQGMQTRLGGKRAGKAGPALWPL